MLGNKKIYSVQILRFFAAFLVLFGHLLMEASKFDLLNSSQDEIARLFPWGSGVDLFFVISGFIICRILLKTESSFFAVKSFFVRRFIRIVPVYWIFTFLMIVVMILFGSILNSSVLKLDHIFASLLFIPWPNPSSGSLRPILGQGWTLNYEVFFYCVAGSSIIIRKPLRIYYVSGVIMCFFMLGNIFMEKSFAFNFFYQSVILEFILGMFLFKIFNSAFELTVWQVVLMVCLGVMLLYLGEKFVPQNEYRFISRGIPSFFIAIGFVMAERVIDNSKRITEFLCLLGDASYSLYLSHPFVIVPSSYLWKISGFDNLYLFLTLFTLLSIFVSVFIYIYIEKKIVTRILKIDKISRHYVTVS